MRTVVLRNSAKHRLADCDLVHELMEQGEPVNFVVHYEALALIAGKSKVVRRSAEEGEKVKWEEVDIHYRPEDGEKAKIVLGDGWASFGTWDLVVCDEVHRLKNPDAQMTKALKKIGAVGRLGLSGSIFENHLEEMWSQLHWL